MNQSFNGDATRMAFLEAASKRILVLDGAMGTMIQERKFTEASFAASASRIGRAICAAIMIS